MGPRRCDRSLKLLITIFVQLRGELFAFVPPDPKSPKFSKTPPPSPADFILREQSALNQGKKHSNFQFHFHLRYRADCRALGTYRVDYERYGWSPRNQSKTKLSYWNCEGRNQNLLETLLSKMLPQKETCKIELFDQCFFFLQSVEIQIGRRKYNKECFWLVGDGEKMWHINWTEI